MFIRFVMKKYVFLFIVILFSLNNLSAQKTKTVKAVGEAVGTDLVQTRKDALHDAKLQALQKSGVKEMIHSFSTILIDDDKVNTNNTARTELSLLMLDGQVRLKEEPQYEQQVINNMIKVSASIKAEVFLEDKTDEEFRIKVEGLKNTYVEGERLQMKITPYKDCYLRIFWFDQSPKAQVEGDEIYPLKNKYVDKKFMKDTTYIYPSLPREFVIGNPQKMEVFKQTNSLLETTLIFVVALKKQIPYDMEYCNYEQFIQWLLKIPASERTVKFQTIGIVSE